MNKFLLISFFCSMLSSTVAADSTLYVYSWMNESGQRYDAKQSLCERIPAPRGFQRIELSPGVYSDWLRHLPLKKEKEKIHLFNGRLWNDQSAHHAVIDIDTGNRNLQQCADAIMRFRGEYLYSIGKYDDISFHFANGERIDFKKWRRGYKVKVRGNKVSWERSHESNSSYRSFRNYMSTIFAYAGTMSMSEDMHRIRDIDRMQVGDVFNYNCHAVLVADMAENPKTGKKVFLIAQGMQPAMDIHIAGNPRNPKISPWFELDFEDDFHMHYGFIFGKNNLYRYPKSGD